jgi:hypothetical protein
VPFNHVISAENVATTLNNTGKYYKVWSRLKDLD